jgi:uncharacterized damage-inducible protein DinB
MASEPNAVEQAVSRTLRDNLEKIQRTADELHQAVNDMVAACASSRASNALPAMLRAQTSAASLSATLEVLSRFVTSSLQPAMLMPFETDTFRVPSMSAPPLPEIEPPPPAPSHPMEEVQWTTPVPAVPTPPVPEIPPLVDQILAVPEIYPQAEAPAFSDVPATVEPAPAMEAANWSDPETVAQPEPLPDFELILPDETQQAAEAPQALEQVESAPVFNLDLLPPDEQELHRRAFRVAKVCMQDIRMLRPEDVRLGREKKDLCSRLRDDIEKAHKEYDRRFQAIHSHPVDYFYDWMVEILGGGDPKALGEDPDPSPVLRR